MPVQLLLLLLVDLIHKDLTRLAGITSALCWAQEAVVELLPQEAVCLGLVVGEDMELDPRLALADGSPSPSRTCHYPLKALASPASARETLAGHRCQARQGCVLKD